MSKKQTILKGTFILTAAGFLSRFMGFFYRIFLSRAFGAENVGLYQLIFPVFSLCVSLTCAGVETAISRTVARKMSMQKQKEAKETFVLGLIFSATSSILVMLMIQRYANPISTYFLKDVRCEPLLTIMSYVLPFTAIHSCICGYCFGLRQTKIPALSQLLEQAVRIGSVYALYCFAVKHQMVPTVAIAVTGLVIGEFCSAVYSANAVTGIPSFSWSSKPKISHSKGCLQELLTLSVPLSANRVLINLLQSVESISIPNQLKIYNHSTSEALSIYGVLTGMALPLILFPSAVTSSVSIMLMPTVAELQTTNSKERMLSIIQKSVGSCALLGFFCSAVFVIGGHWIGTFLFDSTLAGKFIATLGWICPFLYSNAAFVSVINGLGKTTTTFCINTLGLFIRIVDVFFAIPFFGIQGYLWGMLVSQLSVTLLCFLSLKRLLNS